MKDTATWRPGTREGAGGFLGPFFLFCPLDRLRNVAHDACMSNQPISTTGREAHASTTGIEAHASTTGIEAHASTTGGWAHALSAQGAASSAHAVAVGRWVRLLPGSCDALVLPDNPDKYHPMLIAASDGWTVGRWVTMTNGQVEERLDVLLPNDRRGYMLRHVNGRYLAGCRDFTAEQAVAHWSNPTHPAPQSAALLLVAVKAHLNGEFNDR